MKDFFKQHKQPLLLYSLVAAVSIVFYFLLLRFDSVVSVVRFLLSILTPFIIGFCIAYLLNPVMKFFENKVFGWIGAKKKKEVSLKTRKICCIITTYLLVLAVIACLVVLLIPQVVDTVESLVKNIPVYFQQFSNGFNRFVAERNWDVSWLEKNVPYDSLMDVATIVLNTCFGWLVNVPVYLTTGFTNVIVGIIISIYFLYDKDRFAKGFTKVLYALVNKNKADKVMDVCSLTHRTFSGFIMGKIIDSAIIGLISFPFMLLIYPPYALLISVIIGVTNVIPFFGPFIGAIPSALLILLVSPDKFIWFIIFVFVLQQFDGNVLGPKILGDSTGISPIWVLFGILAGSKILGFLGMIVGVPITAVAYALFRNYINKKHQEQEYEPTTCETDS